MNKQISASFPSALAEIDRSVVEAAREIKVLSRLSWPASVRRKFLEGWHRGQPKLPSVSYAPAADLDDSARRLEQALVALSAFEDPAAAFLRRTAHSYLDLCGLLRAAGTEDMLTYSRRLYGAPGDRLSEGSVNSRDAAEHFLTLSSQYSQAVHLHDSDYCLSAQTLKQELEVRLGEVFPAGLVQVVIDRELASKAAAGPTRVRLRDDTHFTEYDLEQLLQHEAFVHSLTALNGRKQRNLTTLGLGAPRTTGPQEGLATFAEVVTGAMDIDRIQRIALRVIGVDMALSGADFLEVFKFFLEAGQPETESFNSSMRIFRGAPVTGGTAFTKDVVYLHGLLEVHTFFRWSMHNQRLELCRYFLAGRMTISDVIELAPLFEAGVLDPPVYVPPWMTKTNGLAGYLAFSIFANKITVEAIGEHHRFERVEDLEV